MSAHRFGQPSRRVLRSEHSLASGADWLCPTMPCGRLPPPVARRGPETPDPDVPNLAPGTWQWQPFGCRGRPAGRQFPGSTFLTGPRSRELPFQSGPLSAAVWGVTRHDTTRVMARGRGTIRVCLLLPPPLRQPSRFANLALNSFGIHWLASARFGSNSFIRVSDFQNLSKVSNVD